MTELLDGVGVLTLSAANNFSTNYANGMGASTLAAANNYTDNYTGMG